MQVQGRQHARKSSRLRLPRVTPACVCLSRRRLRSLRWRRRRCRHRALLRWRIPARRLWRRSHFRLATRREGGASHSVTWPGNSAEGAPHQAQRGHAQNQQQSNAFPHRSSPSSVRVAQSAVSARLTILTQFARPSIPNTLAASPKPIVKGKRKQKAASVQSGANNRPSITLRHLSYFHFSVFDFPSSLFHFPPSHEASSSRP